MGSILMTKAVCWVTPSKVMVVRSFEVVAAYVLQVWIRCFYTTETFSRSLFLMSQVTGQTPVLNINDRATGGRRTKDILGGPKGWGPKKKVANIEIYVIFEVFAFCGGRTKTDFKDRGLLGRAMPES